MQACAAGDSSHKVKGHEAKRLRQLESENARVKKLLAEAELDKAMLKELAEGNF